MKAIPALAVASLFAGCAGPESTPPKIGMANPASTYCIQIGGTLHIKDTPAGQVGMCTLPDGTVIEEWELFRRDHPSR